jgi:Na+/proline symporter
MASNTVNYTVNDDTAYALLLAVLIITAFLAIVAAMNTKGGDQFLANVLAPSDHFLSARGTAPWTTIAMSFFASGMGAWIVYGTTEMGANPALSWFGVVGYSAASAFACLILYFLGPLVKNVVDQNDGGEKGFGITDFGLIRYGRIMQLYIAALSCFYMFIYLVSELTSIGNVYALITEGGVHTTTLRYSTGEISDWTFATKIAVIVAVITTMYTAVAGLPASILTDKFQGVTVAGVVIALTVACITKDENKVTSSQFEKASASTNEGGYAMVSLFIAIASAELFNQGSWQRVWAAKSDRDFGIGVLLGSFLIFLVMMFFGVMGMVAYAKDPTSYDNFDKFAYLSFFDLLAPMGKVWHIITLLLLTTLCASSVDTLQNALASVLSRDLMRYDCANLSRIAVIGFNVPAIIMAAEGYDVISLFLVADLVCATAVVPVFLGLIPASKGGPTELGALIGCVAGFAAVVVNGQINDVKTAVKFDGTVMEDNEYLAYFWLTNGGICALCGTDTMYTFLAVPAVSGVVTIVASKLDCLIRGQAARKPLISCTSTTDRRVEQLEDYIKEKGMEVPDRPDQTQV